MIDKFKDRASLSFKKPVSKLKTDFTMVDVLSMTLIKVKNHNCQLHKNIAAWKV